MPYFRRQHVDSGDVITLKFEVFIKEACRMLETRLGLFVIEAGFELGN